MPSLSSDPTEEESRLYAAWDTLNKALQTASPWPVRATHRVSASVADVLAAAGTMRELEQRVLNDADHQHTFLRSPVRLAVRAYLAQHPDTNMDQLVELQARLHTELREEEARFSRAWADDWAQTADVKMFRQRQYAAAVKGFYVFVRNLQDACFQIWRLTQDPPLLGHSSLSKALGRAGSSKPLRTQIESALPGYPAWFDQFTHLRDSFKMGVDAFGGTEWKGTEMNPRVFLSVHRVTEHPPLSDIAATISWKDHAAALGQSARFLELAAQRFAPNATLVAEFLSRLADRPV